jgi:DNA helicase-2/ATP-dependent DNA helicase PcrA
MDVSPILDPLNEAQREAVTADRQAMLVLAGAGSGKTRVLVHRIAWLVDVENIAPRSILAVTFTNKAANEMRGRIEALLGRPAVAMWVGTFHGLAHRILRQHWQEAGLPQTFQILDSEDQLRVIRRMFKNMGVDETRWIPRELQWFINAQKDEGIRAANMDDRGDSNRRQMIKHYAAYQEICDNSGVVDFAELLLRAHELWLQNTDLLEHYRRRFTHVLVDEFQDTNTIQYAWLRLLAGDQGVPFAVGDDDQSIYGWRGAKVENLFQFQKHYPKAGLVRLEQNYRSTGTILNAANKLIGNNSGRLGKNLWTEGADGELIKVFEAFNERDEADFVLGRVKDWVDQGNPRSEIAILYRSNAQSRIFEEVIMNAAVPYRVYGGLRFFERQEIKDALAYLRLIANRDDDTSFERIVNLPPRGIGARSMDTIRQFARANAISLWHAASSLAGGQLNNRAANAVQAFLALIEPLGRENQGLELYEQVDSVIRCSGLIEHFRKEKGEKAETRIENLEELVSAARGYRHGADGRLSGTRGAGIGRESGWRMGRLRAIDDAAQRQGSGVSGCFSMRFGGRAFPAPTFTGRQRRPRGRTPTLLCRHDSCKTTTLPDLCQSTTSARHGQLRPSIAFSQRNSARIYRGGAQWFFGQAAGHKKPLFRTQGNGRHAPRTAGQAWSIWQRSGNGLRGAGCSCQGSGKFRVCRHKMAGSCLCRA